MFARNHRAIREHNKMTSENEKRMLWRQWCDEGGELPSILSDLICGAKTRAGTACKRRDLYRSGRCKLHGGHSTGPRTKKGKRRSAQNGYAEKRSKPLERGELANDLGKFRAVGAGKHT